MTTPSNPVVLITKNRLLAKSFGDRQSDFSSKWEPRTLSQVLAQLKDTLKSDTIKVIVGDNLSFLSPVFFKDDGSDLKTQVLKHAKSVLPESPDNLGIDWKQVYRSEGIVAVQLFAMQKSFLSLLGRSTQSAGLTIESIEPVAYVLSRVLPASDQAHLILWEDDALEAAIIYEGQVLNSTRITDLSVYNQLDTLISSVKDKFGLEVVQIIMPPKTKKVSAETLSQKTSKPVKTRTFDLHSTAAGKADISGEDEDVLNITPKEVFAEEETSDQLDTSENQDMDSDQTESPDETPLPEINPVAPKLPRQSTQSDDESPPSSHQPAGFELNDKKGPSSKIIMIVFFLLALLITALVGGVIVYRNALTSKDQPTPQQTTESTPSPEPTPEPTPEAEIDRTQIKVQVLNGSGIAGLASKVVAVLESAGYSDVASGNADNFDYQQTILQTKPDNPPLQQLLQSDLESDYPIAETTSDLAESSEYDAVIIIGQDQQ